MAFLTLGIETSCDETAAAVLCDADQIQSSITLSQLIHTRFGGVVPELASRAHIQQIVPVVNSALETAGVRVDALNLVAATNTPGLMGALLVGLPFAKSIAWSLDIPFVGVNHLEGHIFAIFLHKPDMPLPFIALIVSGGHTELVLVLDRCQYQMLGATLDDACGEAFDKAAKMLGLPYPGGLFIEEYARQGRRTIDFPRPKVAGMDFSFSGLKTALLYYLRDNSLSGVLAPSRPLYDICHSFQEALIDALLAKVKLAVTETGVRRVAVTGGVAVNNRLRERLQEASQCSGFSAVFPAPALCTDNAAMIAASGYARFQRFGASPLNLPARAREALA